jgi:hypothetical protein
MTGELVKDVPLPDTMRFTANHASSATAKTWAGVPAAPNGPKMSREGIAKRRKMYTVNADVAS